MGKGAGTPWRNGKYKSGDGGQDLITIDGEKVTFSSFNQAKLKYGSFGDADSKIVEMTGERNYNVELSFDFIGKKMADYGVLTEDGTKLTLKGPSGIRTRLWITDEEAELLAKDGDPIEAPRSHYKVEPERQGRLIWISGPPGLGKSTSAQILSREHGYVYYEGDCFFGLRNPYIPPDVENPTMATRLQRKLIGEGVKERKAICDKAVKQWEAMLEGKEVDEAVLEAMYREMCKDIARERARLGGDWAIAVVLHSQRIRDFVRSQLGPDLEIVVLEMSLEEQMERIRGRHEGNQDAVQMMKAFFEFCEPAGPEEANTIGITVTPGMSPGEVLRRILQANSSEGENTHL